MHHFQQAAPATPAPASTGLPVDRAADERFAALCASQPKGEKRPIPASTGGDEAEARAWETPRKFPSGATPQPVPVAPCVGTTTHECHRPAMYCAHHKDAALAAAEERGRADGKAAAALACAMCATCNHGALSARGQGGGPDAKASPASPEVLDER